MMAPASPAAGRAVQAAPQPLRLPDPRDGEQQAGLDGLADAVFDFDFGVLRTLQPRGGRQDCGVARAWAFTGSGWLLLDRREMPLCIGLAPAHWIVTHTARSDRVPPDE
jgi:hypothetical protein